jgi:hypothetical protein
LTRGSERSSLGPELSLTEASLPVNVYACAKWRVRCSGEAIINVAAAADVSSLLPPPPPPPLPPAATERVVQSHAECGDSTMFTMQTCSHATTAPYRSRYWRDMTLTLLWETANGNQSVSGPMDCGIEGFEMYTCTVTAVKIVTWIHSTLPNQKVHYFVNNEAEPATCRRINFKLPDRSTANAADSSAWQPVDSRHPQSRIACMAAAAWKNASLVRIRWVNLRIRKDSMNIIIKFRVIYTCRECQ